MEEMTVVKKRKMKELKNGRSKLLSCNYNALESIIRARGFNTNDLAEMLGYQRGYFAKAKSNGMIGETCVKLLAERYNILPSQYEVQGYASELPVSDAKRKVLDKIKKPEVVNNQITLRVTVDAAQLSEIIKQAVIEAFNSL